MKNITLSVPDTVYRKARIAAAKQDTSVSALVADLLNKLGGEEKDQHQAKVAHLFATFDAVKQFSAGDRLPRSRIFRKVRTKSGAQK